MRGWRWGRFNDQGTARLDHNLNLYVTQPRYFLRTWYHFSSSATPVCRGATGSGFRDTARQNWPESNSIQDHLEPWKFYQDTGSCRFLDFRNPTRFLAIHRLCKQQISQFLFEEAKIMFKKYSCVFFHVVFLQLSIIIFNNLFLLFSWNQLLDHRGHTIYFLFTFSTITFIHCLLKIYKPFSTERNKILFWRQKQFLICLMYVGLYT